MTVTLLGPQRFRMTAGPAVRALAPEGPLAVVNAGWEEREPEDAELDAVLDGRSLNLALYRRWLDVTARDPELAAAQVKRDEALEQLHAVYLQRLDAAMTSAYAIQQGEARPALREAALTDAVEGVRRLDEWYLRLAGEIRGEAATAWPLAERPVVAEHRAAVAAALGRASALVVAGGHVGVLLDVLRLFDVRPPEHLPVVAWSAGAMALSERVVLFHDRAPQGPGHAEVYDTGLGLVRGLVPLPHARRRLRLDDHDRMALFARRFAPLRCLVLDDGVRVDLGADGTLPAGARVLTETGDLTTLEAA